MTDLNALRSIYAEYDETALQVRKNARPFDGIMGLGSDPRRDRCHREFYDGVQAWIEEFRSQGPEPDAVFEAVREILLAADSRRNTDTYWFCYAAHGLTADLVPLMTSEQCRTLTALYDERFPKADRLPVQKALYKKLKKAGK